MITSPSTLVDSTAGVTDVLVTNEGEGMDGYYSPPPSYGQAPVSDPDLRAGLPRSTHPRFSYLSMDGDAVIYLLMIESHDLHNREGWRAYARNALRESKSLNCSAVDVNIDS